MTIKGHKIVLRKHKKGFTLIELVAVIIIIGVLLLIIIPNVAGVIKRAGQKTFTASAKGILRASTDYFAENDFEIAEGQCIDATKGTIEFDKEYQIKSGKICYINGASYLQNVSDGKYCATGNMDNLNVNLCNELVAVTFSITDAYNNFFGYESDNNNVFLTNSNEFAAVPEYGTGSYENITMQVTKGSPLGAYIDSYKKTGYVSYCYEGHCSEGTNMTYYSLWNITSGDCTAIVPAVWDKPFDSSTIINSDTTYTVLSAGAADNEMCK